MADSDSANASLLATIVEHLPWFAAVVDRERRYVWVNRLDPTLTWETVRGRRVEEFCHTGSVERQLEAIEQAFQDGRPRYCEVLAYGRGDTATWYGTHIIPLAVEGRVERLLLLSSDETPRRRALEQLECSERQFRGLTEHMPDWVFVIDRHHRIVYTNHGPPPETGSSREQLVGARIEEIVGHDEKLARGAIEEMFERGAPTAYSSPGVGNGRHWKVRVCPFAEDGGEPRGLVIATDVTEAVDARRRLQENEVRLGLALEASGMGMWSWDARSGEIQWDERACELFGLRQAPSDFEAYLERIHPEDRAAKERRVLDAMQTRTFRDLPHRIVQPDGTVRWLFCKGTVLSDHEGAVNGIAGGVFDITETQELEAQLRQAQKLDAVGKLAGGVAHDFNNLLLVIEGGVELANVARNEHERKEALEGIKKATRRAADLTRQLLAFSRQQPLQRKTLNLGELIGSLARLLRRVLPETIALELDVAPHLPSVPADRAQLEQLVINLCVNARDAMPRGGRLVLEVSDVSVSKNDDEHRDLECGRYVRLRVIDTGTGMPIEVRERIFEPFFTTKGPGEGTGLGLSIVYGVVRQHEGHIRVDSEPGAGSTFTVHLPSTDRPVDPELPTTADEVVSGNETILLAEDDPMVRGVVAKLLERAGYRVLTAEDGEKALELFARSNDAVDLVLLDCVMPNMGGWDALRELRRARHELPVIVSSGYAETPESDPGEPGTFWLAKPYGSQTLLALVRHALDARPSCG